MYALFRKYGGIHDIKHNDDLKSFEFQYRFITDERLYCDNGEFMIDGKKFLFRKNDKNVTRNPQPLVVHVNDELMMAPTDDSPQNILHALNDDCLRGIFNQLDVVSLYKAAYVCQRFNGIAKQAFKSRYRQKGFRLMKDAYNKRSALSLFEIDMILQTFGSDVCIFGADAELNQEILLRMCVKHCPEIESIDLTGVRWSASIETDIRRLLPRLKKLKLFPVNRCSTGDLFIGDWPLEKLHLAGKFDWETSKINMPNLIELSLFAWWEKLTERHLQHSISGNPQLRSVKFELFTISASMFNLLPKYLSDFHEIKFESCRVVMNGETDAPPILTEWNNIKSLGELHIRCSKGFPTEELLALLAVNGAPLKSLALGMCEEMKINNNFVHKHVAPLKQLETVKVLGQYLPDIDIDRLARDLPKLSKMNFRCRKITANEIKEFIRRIVQPIDLVIQVQTVMLDSDASESDFDETTDLLQARPGIEFMVEIARNDLIVSIFCFLVPVSNWCIVIK